MQVNQPIDEDEIDLKEVFRTVYVYRYMIISFIMVFMVTSIAFAYFKTNVYQAFSTVEISDDKQMGSQDDILSMAMEGGSANVDTEIQIIKSAFLAEKALKHVNLTHRYYSSKKLKQIELYKTSPFEVGLLKGFGVTFYLYPEDETHYRLEVEDAKDLHGNTWSYDAVHTYGKEVVNEHFHVNIVKKDDFLESAYSFVIYDVAKMARMVQKEHVSVSQISKKASVVSISYSDNNALRAKEFTDALAKAYVKHTVDKKVREADLKLTFIEKQLKGVTQSLENAAIKLEEFKKSSNTIDLGTKAQTLTQQMSQNEVALSEISIMEKMLGSMYRQIKTGKNLASISVEGLGMDNSSLSVMLKELQDAILKKKILREDYTEVYPEVVKLTRTIRQLQRTITGKIKSLGTNIKEKKKLLESSIAKQQALLNTLPASERTNSDLQRKYMVNEKIYSYLLEKQSETQILKASTVSQNMIIDNAFIPEKPIKPKRKLIVLVGIILGFIVGIAMAFLRAFLDNRIKTEEDIEKATRVPIYGVIPHIKEDADKIKVFLSPKSVVSEAYRSLRTNLQFLGKNEGSLVISVTSTVGGEGKTTISTNLSAIMSMSGKKNHNYKLGYA